MPYGFVRKSENFVRFNTTGQWWGETDEGLVETITLARSVGFKVMIKPQVWFRHSEYTGSYVPPDSARVVFEKSFEEFVLHYAKIAQRTSVELYCIGTEWKKFIESNPEYWRQLIVRIKEVYKGKLTYAANWDEYKHVPFWRQLDYIGINAYFPLSDKDHPTIQQLKDDWQPWTKEISKVANESSIPVLFTEYGYRSTLKNTNKPWESYTKPGVSMSNQQMAYQALYEEFWDRKWFAGGFV